MSSGHTFVRTDCPNVLCSKRCNVCEQMRIPSSVAAHKLFEQSNHFVDAIKLIHVKAGIANLVIKTYH